MDLLDKVLLEWSARTEKGYPDLNNEQDLALFESMFGFELNEIADAGYEQVIAHALFGSGKEVAKIPSPAKKYSLGNNSSVSQEDLEVWKKLYPVKPPKKGKELGTAGSLGAGNGEIALYWLLTGSGYKVADGRGDEQPDLLINGNIGLEVKAYGKRNITLGRFGKDYDTRKKLGLVLGLDILVSNLTGEKDRAPSIDSFNKDELVRGFVQLAKFSSNSNLRSASSDFELIGSIYSKIDSLLQNLELPQDFKPNEGAVAILKQLLKTKAQKKPGYGGYIVDVSENGEIDYKQVTEEKINSLSNEQILKYVSANGSSLKIYPDELFG